MQPKEILTFDGFSPGTLKFLKEVKVRNSKKWFEQHRAEYDELLLSPLRALVCALSGTVFGIDKRIETSPSVNRTISRIYRDIRFSKDKSLFRDEAWISFKRRTVEKMTIPEFYFYITPTTYEYGMGYYSADSASMNLFRTALTKKAASFRKAIAFLETGTWDFERYEDRYKRFVKNDGPEDLQDWYQLRSFCYRIRRKTDRRLYSPGLADEIAEVFTVLRPLYDFLIKNTISSE